MKKIIIILIYVDTSLFDYSITLKKQLAIYKSNALVWNPYGQKSNPGGLR
jgi:hypothetical protein